MCKTPLGNPQMCNTPLCNIPLCNTPVCNTPLCNIPQCNTPLFTTPLFNTSLCKTPLCNTPLCITPLCNTPLCNTLLCNTTVCITPLCNTATSPCHEASSYTGSSREAQPSPSLSSFSYTPILLYKGLSKHQEVSSTPVRDESDKIDCGFWDLLGAIKRQILKYMIHVVHINYCWSMKEK